ncbi:MAG: Outer rane receptor for ferrienterochelin and colicin [Bryobacterales bacterium]|nr:Outer rane receptor for ferrienterochelin and colicin [Bryobacterales bacterium]
MSRDFPYRRVTRGCVLLLLGFAVIAPQVARGQLLQGTIDGNVTDPSQAALADARISIVEVATGFSRETVTNSAGAYTLPNLPPGTYTVTISSAGFQPYKRTNVTVTVQTVTRVDAALSLGGVNESVTVSGDTAVLQTDRADVRFELGGQSLSKLPVPIGRNYQMLFTTIPGVSPPQSAHSFAANSSRSLAFTVNGGNVNTNDTRIDGAGTRCFNSTDVIQYVPALESIQSVSLASNSFDADQSAGGGAVSVTVKSGTNVLHGSLFEDHADRSLEAYAWIANRNLPKLPFINNQFGGTIGGPIRKNKLFYFLSFEGVRAVQGNAVVAQVPTAEMKAGNLSASPTLIYDPMTGNADGSARTPFPGNIIPSSRIDPGVQALIATGSWPNPNQRGAGAFGLSQNFLCSGCQGNSGNQRDQWDGKISWNPTSKLSTFARLGVSNGSWYNPQIFGLLGGTQVSPTNGAIGTGGAHVFNGTVSASYVFSPTVFVDAYFGYDRGDMVANQPNQDNNLGWTLLAIPGLNTAALPANRRLEQGGMPQLAIDGFTTVGRSNTYQPFADRDAEKNYNASINWIKGSHSIRAGFDSDFQDSNEMQYEMTGSSYNTSAGGFHFAQGTTQLKGGSSGNDFNAFASFLLGLPQDSGKIYQFPDEYYTRAKYFGIYLRDSWQISRKWTVNYGGRWDYYPFPTRKDTGLEIYNPESATTSICGVGAVPGDCGITRDKQRIVPRLGLAYRPTESTVIRAGYGIVTNPVAFLGQTLGSRENFPYLFSQIILPPNSLSYGTTLRQGLPAVSPPDLSTGIIPVPGYAYIKTYVNSNYTRGYIQSWNLTVEQRVKNWLASAGYVGSRAVDMQNNLQMNWSPINGGTAGQILNQLTGRTASTIYPGTLGTNTYDSLQTRMGGQFSGFQVNFTYTFSKALGYAIDPRVVIPQYYELNRGPLATDIAHMFSASSFADLPFGEGKRWVQKGFASKLAGGWQISTVVTAHTGTPFTATASNSTLNSPNSGQFADCLAPPQEIGDIHSWYDKSAFAVPSAGRFGTCGTNSLRGPGVVNADLGLERKFKISEKLGMSFRAEMFNLANTPHHSNPDGNVSSGTFMQALGIVSTGREGIEQRAVRFAVRLAF